jgi:Lrp/AsnC family transcriptional regulator for asnA, asnC and gidA
MPPKVEIDEIDDQIIHMLIKDARLGLKEIAKKCGISAVSVFNRINRLKKQGVITGATLFASLDNFKLYLVASIGMETENDADVDEILRFFQEHTCLIEPSVSIGKYDLYALIYAENFESLNDRVEMVRRLRGIRKVVVSVWSGLPILNYENIDLMPKNGGA